MVTLNDFLRSSQRAMRGSARPVAASKLARRADRRDAGVRLRPRWDVLALIVLLFLGGCRFYPPPVPVDFPDDPRVVDGTWEIRTQGLTDGVFGATLNAGATRLLMWNRDTTWLYVSNGDGDWLETPGPDPLPNPRGSRFDTTIDAFMRVKKVGRTLTVRTSPFDGGPTTSSDVSVTAGHAITKAAGGSGRIFAVARDADGRFTLWWWDARTGASEGHRSLPHFDSVRVSANGRILSFYTARSTQARLVDTMAPQSSRTIDLGICTSDAMGLASADGRWFVANDCLGDVVIYDLHTADGNRRKIGLRSNIGLRFATDSDELVWFNGIDQIWSYLPASREFTMLYQFPERVATDLRTWRGPLRLVRSASDGSDSLVDGNRRRQVTDDHRGQLFFGNGSGGLRVLDLTRSTITDLPELELTTAVMSVKASKPVHTETSNGYEFAGTIGGLDPDPLPIHGTVDAWRLHEYRPGTQSLPPPHVHGWVELEDPADHGTLYRLEFSTQNPRATTFSGTLYDFTSDVGYVVEMSEVK